MDDLQQIREYISKEKARASEEITAYSVDCDDCGQVVMWHRWVSRFETLIELEQKIARIAPATEQSDEEDAPW